MARRLKPKRVWRTVALNTFQSRASQVGGVADIHTLITESDLEDYYGPGGKVLIERIVGDIYCSSSGSGAEYAVLFCLQVQNAVATSAWGATSFQPSTNWAENVDDKATMWTRLWADLGQTAGHQYIPVDVRVKRYVGQGDSVSMIVQNAMSVAAGVADVDYFYNLRILMRSGVY